MQWSMKKNCSFANHNDQEHVALLSSGMRPTGTAAARELGGVPVAWVKSSKVAIVVLLENEVAALN